MMMIISKVQRHGSMERVYVRYLREAMKAMAIMIVMETVQGWGLNMMVIRPESLVSFVCLHGSVLSAHAHTHSLYIDCSVNKDGG